MKKINFGALTWEEVKEWMQENVGAVGDEDEFRELLPRFFELAWKIGTAGEELEIGSSWNYNRQDWLPHEREAIKDCFILLWRLTLTNEDWFGMSEILSSSQSADISWLPFLDCWLQSSLSTSAFAFAISLSHWDNFPLEARQWLCQKAVFERIQADFFSAQDDEARATISKFEEQLRFYCAR